MAFNKIRKNKKFKFSYIQKIVAAVLTIGIISGITCGNTVIAAVKNYLFDNNLGIQKAVDNGYVQNLEDNVMKGDGVEIRVNNVIKDSRRVALSLNFKFDDKELVKYCKGIKIEDLNIHDDTGKEIQAWYNADNFNLDEETGGIILNIFLDYSKSSNKSTFSENDIKNISSLNLKFKRIILVADASEKIDKVTLPQIDDYTKDKFERAGFQLLKVFEENLETTIKLDEKFKDIGPIEYKSSENNDFINIVSAEVYPTGMEITFNYKNQTGILPDEILDDTESITLVDNNGIIYKSIDSMGQSIGDNDEHILTKSFYVTTFDKTGDLKMIFKDLNGNTQEIKLVKAN